MKVYKYEKDGFTKAYPTAQDVEIMQLDGVAGIWCSPLSVEKYEKTVIMLDDIGEEKRKELQGKIQKILDTPYNEIKRAFSRW